MLPFPLPPELLAATGRANIRLLHASPVSGGSINRCYRLETSAGIFFLKENEAEKFPGMFEAEQKGLELLAQNHAFTVPAVYAQLISGNHSLLLLEWLEKSSPGKSSWFDAGTCLAKLHRATADAFGLDHDNYIGSLPQSNHRHASWADFFALERILPQVKRARDNGAIDAGISTRAERFCARMEEIFPKETPSLLHGDLWSGNFFFAQNGPAVFDPAVYYGHREMDLAMTKLFGGFDPDFYSGYENEFAPEKKWRQRVDFCNLYPLLVHVNLFGGGYLYDVKSILSSF